MDKKCNETDVVFKDETVKIVLNTEGIRDNISKELRSLLDYFCGHINDETEFIQELDKTVHQVKNNKAWRERYMTLEEKFEWYREDGRDAAILSFITSRRNDGYSDEEIEKEVKHIFSVDMKELIKIKS